MYPNVIWDYGRHFFQRRLYQLLKFLTSVEHNMKRDNDDDCEVTHLSLTSFALNLFFWLFSSWETCKTVGANWFLVFLLGRRKNFVPILILSVHFQMITRYLGTQTHNIYHSTEFIREWEKECTQSYEPVFLVLRVGVISY